MAWEADLLSFERKGDVIEHVVKFSNGEKSFERRFKSDNPGQSFLESRVAQEIARQQSLDSYLASLVPGKITIGEPPVVDSDASEFFGLLAKLNAAKDASAKGFSVAAVAELEAEVKSKFKQEYIADPRWK